MTDTITTGFLTNHWLLSILGIVVLCCIERTRPYGIKLAMAAAGVVLFWIFIWTLRSYHSCVIIRQYIGAWWVEISIVFAALTIWASSIAYAIRFIVAVPVAWIAIMLWTYIYGFISTIILEPIISLISSDASGIIGIIGNLTNIITFVFITQIVAGKFKPAVTIIVSLFIIGLEWSFMQSRDHECTMMPVVLGNSELTYWQWIDFTLSIILLILLTVESFRKKEIHRNQDISDINKQDLQSTLKRLYSGLKRN